MPVGMVKSKTYAFSQSGKTIKPHET